MRRLVSSIGVVALLAVTGACSPGDPPASSDSAGETPRASSSDAPSRTESDAPAAAPAPLERATVEVYYPAVIGDGLVGKFSEIFHTVTPGDQAKQIVADLMSDPDTPQAMRALPQGTRLRQAFVLDNGDCYLDFSRDLVQGIGGGSMEEILTVYSIIDSVVMNVSEIRRVGILVEGEPIETLNGHMDLRRPLKPNMSLILAPVVVRGPGDATDGMIASTALAAAPTR